jgi:DNA-binding NarL/FixJ family response regulator
MRVVLADDHRLMLDGVRRALEADGGFEIVGETQDGSQVLGIVRSTKPDLVLLDVRMPKMDGLACLDEIHRLDPEIKVVMLSASTSPDLVAAALRRGASAYLPKSVDPTDLPAMLRQALAGTLPAADGTTGDDAAANEADTLGLTERETAILQALARGSSNGEIAKQMWVTEQTVKFHLTNVYRKLGVKNRTQAVRIAYQHGIVESPLFTDDE